MDVPSSIKIDSPLPMSRKPAPFVCVLLTLGLLLPGSARAASYKYLRSGQAANRTAPTTAGTALMGGGSDLDVAFKWLCDRAGAGDFLILRARGDDSYNSYVRELCSLNSVATLVISNRKAASDPAVAAIIHDAEAIFIAGGDQARYVRFWRKTPVEDALNAHIAAGKPLGGTSAGLAVLGQFSFAALHDTVVSREALANPFHKRVTLTRDFLRVSLLANTITDTHFAARDRMGRTLVFLARLMQEGWSPAPRSIAVDEKAAVLVEADGSASVVGSGAAYFLRPTDPPVVCQPKTPLTFRNIATYRVPQGQHFDLVHWTGTGGASYSLSVDRGVIVSTQPGGSVY